MSEYGPRRTTTMRKRTRRGRRASVAAWRAGVTAVVLVVLVGVFFIVRAGASRLFTRTPAAASASSSANASAVSSRTTVTPAKGANAPAPSNASTQPAWQTADPSWMAKYEGKIVDGFKPEPGYKAIALTFDDGPNWETKYVISTLKRYGGAGTFFDTGRNLSKPEYGAAQAKLVWDAGFEVGNHTQHHTINGTSSLWHRSYATDLAEIKGPDKYVKAGTGRNTVWVRPMGGEIDATGVKAAADTGHLVIDWTIDSNDSHGGPRTPDYIYNEVVSNARSGAVVLLHVTHPESMKALPRICKTLTQEGYKLVTVSDLAQHSTGPITQSIPQ